MKTTVTGGKVGKYEPSHPSTLVMHSKSPRVIGNSVKQPVNQPMMLQSEDTRAAIYVHGKKYSGAQPSRSTISAKSQGLNIVGVSSKQNTKNTLESQRHHLKSSS